MSSGDLQGRSSSSLI